MNKLEQIQNSIVSYPDYKKFENILLDVNFGIKDFINPLNFFLPTPEKVQDFDTSNFILSIFSKSIVRLPTFRIIDEQIEKFSRFENYTKKDEVNNIALWILSSLKYSASTTLRVGRELEVNQSNNPRDGRLDVVAVKNDEVLIIETKTDLKSLLNENRFSYQISGYSKECRKYTLEHLNSDKISLLLAIGGEETDIFPPEHNDCTTGKVGNISKIFYDKIIENNIKFISANAIWTIIAYKYCTDSNLDLFDFIWKIFSKDGVIGLLSAGIVMNKNGSILIEPIDLKTI